MVRAVCRYCGGNALPTVMGSSFICAGCALHYYMCIRTMPTEYAGPVRGVAERMMRDIPNPFAAVPMEAVT